jgi:hypothetical protein
VKPLRPIILGPKTIALLRREWEKRYKGPLKSILGREIVESQEVPEA